MSYSEARSALKEKGVCFCPSCIIIELRQLDGSHEKRAEILENSKSEAQSQLHEAG